MIQNHFLNLHSCMFYLLSQVEESPGTANMNTTTTRKGWRRHEMARNLIWCLYSDQWDVLKERISWNICMSKPISIVFCFLGKLLNNLKYSDDISMFLLFPPAASTLTPHVKTTLRGWKGSSYQTFIHFSIQDFLWL